MADLFRKLQESASGPGGVKRRCWCQCCNHHFRFKDRKMLNRIARRRLKRMTRREVNDG